MSEYNGILAFIKELERLKDITRTAWTREGRQESVAEHSWRLSLFVLTLEDYFPALDLNRVIRMCLIHDLGEAYEGDVSAKIAVDPGNKLATEEEALLKLLALLPENLRQKLVTLWWEYNNGESKEARLAKALDKMETIIQHNQGNNPLDFDYEFNLEYGSKYAIDDPVLHEIRAIIDQETLDKVKINRG